MSASLTDPSAKLDILLSGESLNRRTVVMPKRYIQRDFTKFSIYWIALVGIFLISFTVAAWRMQVKPLQFQAPPPSTYDLFMPDVSLIAEVISVDPISRTIVMNWYPKLTSENCSSNHSTVIDIYIPNTLLDMTSPLWTAQTVDQPAYRLNSTQSCANVMQAYSSFRTITKLVASKEYLVLQVVEDQSSFQSYPFDVYLAPFAFYTRNQETGDVAALKISQAFGVAVNFKISLLNSFVNIHGPGMEYLQIYLRVERSTATKIFVVVVAVMNWLTATVFLTICASTIVYSNPAIYSEMFVVPIGALFAFSSIRANLPGAPAGFGASIDMFTIVPVLVIMSACSFFLLLIVLYRRIMADTRKEKHETGKHPSLYARVPNLRI